MGDLAEMAQMVNTASSALEKLSGSHGSRSARRKLLRSIYASINNARLRGASLKSIAESISASTGMTISETSLHYHLRKLAEEEKAAALRISRSIVENRAEKRA